MHGFIIESSYHSPDMLTRRPLCYTDTINVKTVDITRIVVYIYTIS